jgi:hypothetical protein
VLDRLGLGWWSGTVTCRCGKIAEEATGVCFNCRVRSVGFSFIGGGGYTRNAFHDRTIAEKRAEVLGDRVLGVDVEPASNWRY